MNRLLPAILGALACASSTFAEIRAAWHFHFGDAELEEGAHPVGPEMDFDRSRGYGFEHRGELRETRIAGAEGLASSGAVIFSARVPEGNYDVTVELLGDESPAPVTIKSESRRLMVEALRPAPLQATAVTFTVNLRSPELKGGGAVALKQREIGAWHWDERLQIEINGERPIIKSIRITPNPRAPTLYIAGDSTVTDQPQEPWIGWGQMLPRFFQSGIAISNHAESGLAFSSFKEQKRLEKILESLSPGDYLLMQFGHNDMKERGAGIGPWQSYTEYLQEFVAAARAKGAKPILITSMKRRRFDEQGRQFATLEEYPHAVRAAATKLQVPLIDLNFMSGVLYGALGPEDSKRAFVHYPAGAFPGQDKALKDDTHFNAYGGYQLARCVIEGLRLAAPELIPYMDPELKPYDPASPDPFEAIAIPASPVASFQKPDGD